ncbi:uncharacterized protein LOC120011431 [Tripterygium wilfordii]|nr:uncharacterized protein LOC120011431 [Tripterygium wilfordii]
MGRLGFSLVFLLAVTLSIHSVMGTFETAEYLLDQLKGVASGEEDATKNLRNNAVEMMDDAKDSYGTWTDWAKNKLEGLGFISESPPPADEALPPSDAFSDSTGSAGYAPAGAPQAY